MRLRFGFLQSIVDQLDKLILLQESIVISVKLIENLVKLLLQFILGDGRLGRLILGTDLRIITLLFWLRLAQSHLI